MLAKFENGYFLEVYVEKNNKGTSEYIYNVYNDDFSFYPCCGRTEYRSMELFYPMNEIDYILTYCEPDEVKGKYELLPFEWIDDYEDYLSKSIKDDISEEKKVITALRRLLDDHDRVYGEYTLVDEEDINYDDYDEDQIQEWKLERQALEYAITVLERR